MKRIAAGLLVGALTLGSTACSIDIRRNDDGSLQVATTITQESLEQEIAGAIADPNVTDMTVDVRDGYILFSASWDAVSKETSHTLTGRLDLAVVDGHVGAIVSDAEIDRIAVPHARVSVWNTRIAARLERAGNRNPDSTLVSVEVGSEQVAMEWHLETPRSRG
jgi:hypothetical protein